MTVNRWAGGEMEAIQPLEAFMAARNAGDNQSLFDAMHLSHLRIPGDGVAIYATHGTL